ncbi:MAG: dihydroorotate dehydrogenase electron transfer subunit, partial [Clostridia bacterium]|nr:dihydroorotate dehydrogenase electron transfer subunit [Clostridia bacterium]
MKQVIYTVRENTALTDAVYRLVLEGDTSALTRPGQFVNLKVHGCYLRRPISVCDWDDTTLTLLYKVVGEGTERMAQWKPGVKVDALTGLGNGFDTHKSGDTPVLIGGGVGIPPLYHLCKALLAEGKTPQVILGFNTAAEIFYAVEFAQLLGSQAGNVHITTVDGTAGTKGFVTDILKDLDYTYFYTCGPMPMFRAIEGTAVTDGQYSFEERMGCGFGACMGCSCKTKNGNKRICKEGPVLDREEIIW